MKHRPRKIKYILYSTFFAISVPTLLLLFLLTGYTIHRQAEADRTDIHIQLSQISTNMENILKRCETQLTNLSALGTPFQIFHHSDTQLEKYTYAYEIMETLQPLLTQDPALGGFFLYSATTDYYHPAYQSNTNPVKMLYSYADQQKIKEFLTRREHPSSERNCWIPFALSDKTVLIRMVGYDTSVLAVIVDPSLDTSVSEALKLSPETLIFYSSKSGSPYTSGLFSEEYLFPYIEKYYEVRYHDDNKYQLIHAPVGEYDLQLCHLVSYQGIFSHLNIFQKILILVLVLLIISMSLIWSYLFKKIIYPIHTLTDTMNKVGNGEFSLRAAENSTVEELQKLGNTFNQMLDNIHRLKLDAYERKIDLQQARLQYLQLQIRPHFYLNCLKGLFSMAEKKQYHEIQESVLALSEYFRYIFRNNHEFVTLAEETRSVSSYLKLQELYFSCYPKLSMEISADSTECLIPPLSILTFVENSIKHCTDTAHIKIHIKTALVTMDGQSWLNITISDNCGGFSKEALQTLNHLDQHDFLYKDYHVGIYNVYYRMKLNYNEKCTMAFYNIEEQGCVELLIPTQKGANS